MGALSSNTNEETPAQRLTKILCLEDNPADRALIEALLSAEGIPCGFTYAKTRDEFESELKQSFDLIISDFSLPSYDGMSALAAARQTQPDTPFIFVSGTIGEGRALESLKNGATDYVLKDRRDRLVSAVQRALREGRERAERKRLEEQLRQAQKMEAIGQLAGGVAHDFNNLLAVIQGNAELSLMTVSETDARTREFLKQITEASHRAANLTRQLLAFSRKQTVRLETVNLKTLIANLTKMLNRIIGEDIRLHCHYEGESFVQADAGMMEQIIVNLVVNSRDAMPHGGRLQISIKNVCIDETFDPAHPEARSGDFACLNVTDTGSGIAPENMARIFEPFFTTKEVGKGTGLGLATVYGIVKQHNGWVSVSSEVGKGTTFEVLLPSAKSPKAATAGPSSESALRGGTEKILLVEDDEAVRIMTRKLLESYGYQIVEAASGRKALDLWPSLGSSIDLLLTDIVMPDGVNGRDLADQLRRFLPDLKVIFVSGYSLSVIGGDTDFLKRRNNYFLQKPFQARALMETIRHCLDTVDRPT